MPKHTDKHIHIQPIIYILSIYLQNKLKWTALNNTLSTEIMYLCNTIEGFLTDHDKIYSSRSNLTLYE